jgi:hypothetical protein
MCVITHCKEQKLLKKERKWSWPLVAYTCNPSYSGGRDQEDCGSKPAQANSSQKCILKKTHHRKQKQGLVEWLKV